MMSQSPEFQAFNVCYNSLVSCLRQAPKDVSDYLRSQEILALDVLEYVANDHHDNGDKARKVLDTVSNQIKSNPKVFNIFVKALRDSGSWTSQAVSKLIKKKESFKKKEEIIKKNKEKNIEKNNNKKNTIQHVKPSKSTFIKLCYGVTAFLLLAIGAGVVYLITSEEGNSKTSLSATNSSVQNNTCNSLDQYEVFPQQNLAHINSLFFGRTKELEELKQLILTNSARVININGPPAFGKSRLANQLGHDLLKHTNMIPNIRYINTVTTEKSFFLCSSNTPSKTIEPTSTSTTTDIKATDSPNKNAYGDNLCTWMAWQKQRTVLIFDNCDPILHSEDRDRFINMLQEFLLMKVQLYNIIVVSQIQLFFLDDGFHSITLGAFSAEESQKLLLHYVPKLTMEQANEISIIVGGCPLALMIVGQLLKHGKQDNLNNLELFLANLKHNLTLQLSKVLSIEQNKLYRVIDVAYKSYLNSKSRQCSHALSLFPGLVSEEMVKSVLSPFLDPFCIENIVSLLLLEELTIEKKRMFSFPSVVHNSLKSVNRVDSDLKVFNSSFLNYYSGYLKDRMKQIYVYQNISDEDKYKLNELEYHNMCEFVRIFLSTGNMDEELTLKTAMALGYLIHEKLIPNKYARKVFLKAHKLYIVSTVFDSLCEYSSNKICFSIFLKFVHYSGCYSTYNSFNKYPKCSHLYDCSKFDYKHIALQDLAHLKHGNLALAYYYCTLQYSVLKKVLILKNQNLTSFLWLNKLILFFTSIIEMIWWMVIKPISFISSLWAAYNTFWNSLCLCLLDILSLYLPAGYVQEQYNDICV